MKKRIFAILLLFATMAICSACGKSGNEKIVPNDTQSEQEEKQIVNPISNGGNLDVGNDY